VAALELERELANGNAEVAEALTKLGTEEGALLLLLDDVSDEIGGPYPRLIMTAGVDIHSFPVKIHLVLVLVKVVVLNIVVSVRTYSK
jgi:hypothetical protein